MALHFPTVHVLLIPQTRHVREHITGLGISITPSIIHSGKQKPGQNYWISKLQLIWHVKDKSIQATAPSLVYLFPGLHSVYGALVLTLKGLCLASFFNPLTVLHLLFINVLEKCLPVCLVNGNPKQVCVASQKVLSFFLHTSLPIILENYHFVP